jgi:probable F420-dependent oxidoreductase
LPGRPERDERYEREDLDVEFGLDIPITRLGTDPGRARTFVKQAEELGFAYVTLVDHVLGASHADRDPPLQYVYDERSQFREPLTFFAWAAGFTERLGFATAVLVLTQRQAAVVAKQAAEIQLLSGDRLRLGVGIGWNYVEYEGLGVPFHHRGARLDEQVEVMRRLWTEDLVDFTGRFHRLDRVSMLPSIRTPVPIWFGGTSDAAFRRCATIGDGFVWDLRLLQLDHGDDPRGAMGDDHVLVRSIERIRAQAAEHGRHPLEIGHQLGTFTDVERALAVVDRWDALGGTHMTMALTGDGADPTRELPAIARSLGSLLTPTA